MLPSFGEYFSGRYTTPWGEAVNVDDAGSDEVRRFFLENAIRWLEEFHVDGLRLGADDVAPAELEALGSDLTVPAKRVLLYLREGTSVA